MLRTFNQTVGTSVVVDSGVILEYLTGSPASKRIEQMLFQNPYIASILVTPLTIIEIYYLIRRESTQERALSEITKLETLVRVVPLEAYLSLVGEVKAVSSFALADSASIALAESRQLKVLFKHEQEIDKKVQSNQEFTFSPRIVFIDDFRAYTSRK